MEEWEEGNPLEIDEKATLINRVMGVYRNAVVRMRFYTEIWYIYICIGAGQAVS